MSSTSRTGGAAALPVAPPPRMERTASPSSSGSRLEAVLHRALTHPLALAAKRPLRNGWWALRGRALVNPPMPAGVRSLLFVCKGNICRSPFAALRDAGETGIACVSAGITASQAARSPEEACAAAAAFGCSLEEHQPLLLTRDMMDGFDAIVVMEAEQLVLLRQRYPDAVSRLFLLSLMDGAPGGYARYNIADPFGQDVATFRACYERIDTALTALLAQIASADRSDTARSGATHHG